MRTPPPRTLIAFARPLLLITLALVLTRCERNEVAKQDPSASDPFAVSTDAAIRVAVRSFLQDGKVTPLKEAPANARLTTGLDDDEIVEKVETVKENGEEFFHVVHFKNGKGFSLVSADRRLIPELAYADRGTFSLTALPDGVKLWIDVVKKQVREAKKQAKAAPIVTSLWAEYESKLSKKRGGRVTYEGEDPEWCSSTSGEHIDTGILLATSPTTELSGGQGAGHNFFCSGAGLQSLWESARWLWPRCHRSSHVVLSFPDPQPGRSDPISLRCDA